MRIREGFALREIAGITVAIPLGAASVDFRRMITLNDTGAFLWRALSAPSSREQLAAELAAAYDVTDETARADVDAFVEKLDHAGLLI